MFFKLFIMFQVCIFHHCNFQIRNSNSVSASALNDDNNNWKRNGYTCDSLETGLEPGAWTLHRSDEFVEILVRKVDDKREEGDCCTSTNKKCQLQLRLSVINDEKTIHGFSIQMRQKPQQNRRLGFFHLNVSSQPFFRYHCDDPAAVTHTFHFKPSDLELPIIWEGPAGFKGEYTIWTVGYTVQDKDLLNEEKGSEQLFSVSLDGTLCGQTKTQQEITANGINDEICNFEKDVEYHGGLVLTAASFEVFRSKDACCKYCINVNDCKAFSWNGNSGKCYLMVKKEPVSLKDNVISGSIMKPTRHSGTSGPCSSFEDGLYLGNDIPVNTRSPKDCCTLCANNERCFSWNWQFLEPKEKKRNCVLTATRLGIEPQGESTDRDYSGAMDEVEKAAGLQTACASGTKLKKGNKFYLLKHIGIYAETREECCEFCQLSNRKECKVYSYNRFDKSCLLKTKKGSKRRDSSWMSGTVEEQKVNN